MELTATKIGNGFTAIKSVSQMKFAPKTAYSIYKIKKELDEKIEFIAEQEKKIMDDYKCKPAEDGMIKLESPEKAQAFAKEMEELHNMTFDIGAEKLTIKFDDLGGQTLTPDDIAGLEGIIDFE